MVYVSMPGCRIYLVSTGKQRTAVKAQTSDDGSLIKVSKVLSACSRIKLIYSDQECTCTYYALVHVYLQCTMYVYASYILTNFMPYM